MRVTEASDRTDHDSSGDVHKIEFAEYTELLVSRRRLERSDLEEGSLRDVESGELYVLRKRSAVSRLQKSV